MAKITIDGVEVEVADGINVIEAAKAADVHVPHFCYHPGLTVVGQCRMCLVEIEGMPKLQAGCSTPIKEGMKIGVYNEKVDKARKGQMEFLLINHPLDCPICDKAGECPLQDYAFNYGSVISRYAEHKRVYPGMDRTAIGPHVVQNMNRCIHCTRCIRFCDEITETSELAFFKRGAATEVGVFPGVPIENWMSACVTDLCPTGALTTREFRFESRVWNLDHTESVCNGCDVGCNIFIGHRSGKIYRYRPRVNEEVNDHWLCDYGRFSHERYETDRMVVPKILRDGYPGVATWEEALELIEENLRASSGSRIASIVSAQMTNEEGYLLRKLFDLLGSSRIHLHVDSLGPIRMKSRTEWMEGTQAGPNGRGLSAVFGAGTANAEDLLTSGAGGVDFLYVTDANFSSRTREAAVIQNLRKAKFLVVGTWENHPLAEVADLVLPTAIFAEKDGTYTNLQGRAQRINRAYPPKGYALSDWDIIRRIGERLFPDEKDFAAPESEALFERLKETTLGLRALEPGKQNEGGVTGPQTNAGA